MLTGILYEEDLKEYDFGPGHPFGGDRFGVFYRFLTERLPPDNNYKIIQAHPATDSDLLLISDKQYIDFTAGYFRAANLGIHYPDRRFDAFQSVDNVPVGRPGRLEEAARIVVGQGKMACDLVQSGAHKKVVSIGGGLHHAKRSYGEGFCIYNDVAFCALYLKQRYGLTRILILDTDAHAGNGTSEYFYEDPQVLLIDLHQDPSTVYPGVGYAYEIGSGPGKGFTVNVPLPMYAGYDSYKLVWEEVVEPVAQDFKPQVIIRNGGSDPHFNDKLTNLGLPVRGFTMIGQKTAHMSRLCEGKVIDLITSGYNKDVLPYAWMAQVAGLAGFDVAVEEPAEIPVRFRADQSYEPTKKAIKEVKEYLRDYWPSLR